MNDFEGDIAIETRIPRLEYDAHASGADRGFDPVRPDKGSRRKGNSLSTTALNRIG